MKEALKAALILTFLIFVQNLQDMDERRTVKLGETFRSFAEAEKRVIPIVSKCLDGMVSAAKAVDERRVRGNRIRREAVSGKTRRLVCNRTRCVSSPSSSRIQRWLWSRLNLALSPPETFPLKTSVRISVKTDQTGPSTTHPKETERRT